MKLEDLSMQEKQRPRSLLAAVLIMLFSAATAGCYLLGINYSSGLGIVLLTAGLTGTLTLCVHSVAGESGK